MSIDYRVEKLTEVDESTLNKLATWMYDWWGKAGGRTYEAVKSYMKHSMNEDRIPQTYGLYVNNKIVGMFQITFDDLFSRPDIYPWIANVFIDEKYRGLGYGMLMLKQVNSIIQKHTPFSKVYLYTKHIGLYERFGWEYIGPIKTFDDHNSIERLYKFEIDTHNREYNNGIGHYTM